MPGVSKAHDVESPVETTKTPDPCLGTGDGRKPLREAHSAESGMICYLNTTLRVLYDAGMAIITNTTEVCDVCRNPRRKVKRYRVGFDGRLVGVLLCREHAVPVEELIELGTYVPSQSPQPKVWTLEEIEAERRKQAQNKKTAPRP